jgi:hypothetical protein
MPKCGTNGCPVYIQSGKRYCRKCVATIKQQRQTEQEWWYSILHKGSKVYVDTETTGLGYNNGNFSFYVRDNHCRAAYCWNRVPRKDDVCDQCLHYRVKNKLSDTVKLRLDWYKGVMSNWLPEQYSTKLENNCKDIIDTVRSLDKAITQARGTPLTGEQLSKLSMLDFILKYASPNGIRFTYIGGK